jgi:antitoxin (DNA-binding transcriptional repressor) of toxin-antitoxin stability system
MIAISLDEIETKLHIYLQRVEAGETVVILRAGKPIAHLEPVDKEPVGLRPYGLCAGEFVVPDDFNDPLPEDILRDFEG